MLSYKKALRAHSIIWVDLSESQVHIMCNVNRVKHEPCLSVRAYILPQIPSSANNVCILWIQTWLQHRWRSLVFLDLPVQWQQRWGLLQVCLSTNDFNNEDLLRVPHLFVCAFTLFTCTKYVTYIITMQLYFGWLNGCFEHFMSNLAQLWVQDAEK